MHNSRATARLPLPLALALLLSLLLAGCGGGGGGSDSTFTGATLSPAPAPLSASAATPSGLTATLAQDRAAVPVGGTVTYTLTLANNTGQPITFTNQLIGSNLQVVSPSGQTVFPLPGMGPTNASVPVALPMTLTPGQSSSGTITASGVFTSPGKYTATATFAILSGSVAATNTTLGPLTVNVQ